MNPLTRREFLQQAVSLGALSAAVMTGTTWGKDQDNAQSGAKIRFGMVTYTWGEDWDLPTLIANLEKTGLLGVELRTGHAHKVEPDLNAAQRQEVKKRFADSQVTLVGLGGTQDFHQPDAAAVEKSIESTKAFIKLSHDIGGTGVKVRPNELPKGVPEEKTIAQIGSALNVLGRFAAEYGQEIRLEIHGRGTNRVPIAKKIINHVDQPNVGLCWNSNVSDLEAPGLDRNFHLVRARLGHTTHVRQLDSKDYPFGELIKLFVQTKYQGWILLEAGGTKPQDRIAAMIEQRKMFEEMMLHAQTN